MTAPTEVLEVMKRKDNARVRMWLDICARCGLCAESCHFFLSNPDHPDYTPAYKNKALKLAYAKKGDLTSEELDWLTDYAYGTCNMCQRCSMYCPYGISIAFLVRTARSIAVAHGRTPPNLGRGTQDHLAHGNNMAIPEEDYVETIEWQLEELQEELPNAEAPIEKEGAEVLITFNPRDIKFYPQNLHAYLKIYNASQENFTFASTGWDSTNYGLFTGDDAAAKYMTGLVIDAGKRLKVSKVASAE